MTNAYDTLLSRGYIEKTSNDNGVKKSLSRPSVIYQGFDPTKPSLHIGHLMSLMVFNYLQKAGHKMLFVVGGATALVGDPSGKSKTRSALTQEEVRNNALSIKRQIQEMGLIDFEHGAAIHQSALLLDNYDWLDMSLMAYLQSVPGFFSVNEMIKRETFRLRLDEHQNLSLLEFLYPTLQGYDFLFLFEEYGCVIQMGGTDQWANILDGIDLIRRKHSQTTYAMTFPLLEDGKTGQKMGKTEGGNVVWLSKSGPNSTSVFDFYQFWIKVPDSELERLFKLFTFLPLDEIHDVISGDPRTAQRRLAFEVTKIVHGEDLAMVAQNDTISISGPPQNSPKGLKTISISLTDIANDIWIVSVLKNALPEITSGHFRRLIANGGVRINGDKVTKTDQSINEDDFIHEGSEAFCIVGYGKGKAIKVVLTDE